MDDASRDTSQLAALTSRVDEAEREVERLQAVVDEQAPEIESLRGSVLASSARVRELEAALARARELHELRERYRRGDPDGSNSAAAGELDELRRRLRKREEALERARARAKRLAAVERSLPFRAYQQIVALPLLRALPSRRGKGPRR